VYHATASGEIEWGHRQITDALSKLTACSDELKEMSMDHLPAVCWADRITSRLATGSSPFQLIFAQAAVLPIALENGTWNTANCIQGIHETVSLIAARRRQLERQREDINVAIQNVKKSRDASKLYFNQATNLLAEDLLIGDLALMHESKREQSQRAKLDGRWEGPSQVTEITPNLVTYRLTELDGAELPGCIDDSSLRNFFTRNETVQGTLEIFTPSNAQEEDLEEFEEFGVKALASH